MMDAQHLIPLFKTHYSIGRSILTLDSKERENGPNSVFKIAEENNIEQIVFVEDQMHGFLKCKKLCESKNIQFIFGLRLSVCDNYDQEGFYKAIIFAKNDNGVKKLYKIYTKAFTEHDGKLCLSDLVDLWSDDLLLFHPFYDSFLHINNFTFQKFTPEFSKIKNMGFFIEENGLPIDFLLKDKVEKYVSNKYPVYRAKSIFYKNREDFEAYQTFRIINNRKVGKQTSINKPELKGCGSAEFCWESYRENL